MPPSYKIDDTKVDLFKMTTDSLWSAYSDKNALHQLNVVNGIQSLCLMCMDQLDLESARSDSEYSNFRRLVFQEFRNMKKVKEYAAQLNITEKNLNEIVKKNTGKSASQIIYNQIILEAKRLLHTGMSAKEVAYDLNFDDPAPFQ